MKVARVSYTDTDGIEHAVTVEARSLYHAVGLAIARFRTSELQRDPGAAAQFVVQPREASPEHKVSRQHFEGWLAREGGSPAETVQRSDIRTILKETATPLESRRRGPWH